MQGITDRLGHVGSARVVLCGHSHRPELIRLPDGVLLLNPGSVGCPAYDDPSAPPHVSEAGSPHARYALLEFRHGEGRGDDAEMTFVALFLRSCPGWWCSWTVAETPCRAPSTAL